MKKYTLALRPAYGKVCINKDQVEEDWKRGATFESYSGTRTSINDKLLKKTGLTHIELRYGKSNEFFTIIPLVQE